MPLTSVSRFPFGILLAWTQVHAVQFVQLPSTLQRADLKRLTTGDFHAEWNPCPFITFAIHFCPRPVISFRCLFPWASGEMGFDSILFLLCLTSCTVYSCELVVDARDRHDYLLAPAKGCEDVDSHFTIARVGELPSISIIGLCHLSSIGYGFWDRENGRSTTGHRLYHTGQTFGGCTRESPSLQLRFWIRSPDSGQRLLRFLGSENISVRQVLWRDMRPAVPSRP